MSPLGNINTKPNDQRHSRTHPEQEREPLPIILAWTTCGPTMDDVRLERPNRPKNWRLERTEHDIVCPGFDQQNVSRCSKAFSPKLPGIVEPWEDSVMYPDEWICGHDTPKLVGPYVDDTPEWDQDRHDVGDNKLR